MNVPERRAIPTDRLTELRRSARAMDEAERKAAQRVLRVVTAAIRAREQHDLDQSPGRQGVAA